MPEMKTLTINNVKYDIRDDTKAPAGYGYGDTMLYISKSTEVELEAALDEILETLESLQSKQITVNCPALVSMTGACTLIKTSTSNGGYAIFTHYGYHGSNGVSVIRKVKISGVWFPAEYENPQMSVGVEYRTPERLNGKTVFVQAVDFGALPNNTSKSVTVPGAYFPFLVTGVTSGTRSIPHGNYATARASSQSVTLTTTIDYSDTTAVLLVKYTKEEP